MNILILAEVSACSVIGGAERMLREQAIGLQNRGHNVSLVVRAPEHDPRPQVSIKGITEFRYPVRRSWAPGFVLSSLTGSLRVFDQITKPVSPDTVVIHQSLAGLGPILFRRQTVPNWVYVCHSLAHEEYLTRNIKGVAGLAGLGTKFYAKLRSWIERLVLRRSNCVVVASEFMRQKVIRNHEIPGERIRLIPGAADVAQFHPPADKRIVRDQLRLPSNKLIFFTVRNLVPRMGLDNLIKAIAEIGEMNEDILLLIGGEGSLRSGLEQLIQSLGLQTTITLTGFIPERDLATYYQCADLVIIPTQALEGFGLVIVEALACATPVLGTPVAAIPEILSQIDPGLIAEGSDAGALAKSIRAIVSRMRRDPTGWIRLGQKGRQLVEDTYNWKKHCESLEALVLPP